MNGSSGRPSSPDSPSAPTGHEHGHECGREYGREFGRQGQPVPGMASGGLGSVHWWRVLRTWLESGTTQSRGVLCRRDTPNAYLIHPYCKQIASDRDD